MNQPDFLPGFPHHPPEFASAVEFCQWHRKEIVDACTANVDNESMIATLALAIGNLLTLLETMWAQE